MGAGMTPLEAVKPSASASAMQAQPQTSVRGVGQPAVDPLGSSVRRLPADPLGSSVRRLPPNGSQFQLGGAPTMGYATATNMASQQAVARAVPSVVQRGTAPTQFGADPSRWMLPQGYGGLRAMPLG